MFLVGRCHCDLETPLSYSMEIIIRESLRRSFQKVVLFVAMIDERSSLEETFCAANNEGFCLGHKTRHECMQR